MIKVAAITSGRHTPSSRYRIRQHIHTLQKSGIFVREYLPIIDKYAPPPWLARHSPNGINRLIWAFWKLAKALVKTPAVIGSRQAQITWLEREMLTGYLSLEPLLDHPLVFDVDDAIWLSPPLGKTAIQWIGRHADMVIAGNSFIAEWFGRYTKAIRIVPTAVDTCQIVPVADVRCTKTDGAHRPFRVGWIGTSGNIKYLSQIEPVLSQFFGQVDAEFWYISNKPPCFSNIPSHRIRFFRWSPQIENRLLPRLDVGLMPLFFDDWSRGKCSFKMLQYMAAEVPVVVTPVGMNVEVLSLGKAGIGAKTPRDWKDALFFLFRHRDIGKQYGKTGRWIVEQYFSSKLISGRLVDIFKGLV